MKVFGSSDEKTEMGEKSSTMKRNNVLEKCSATTPPCHSEEPKIATAVESRNGVEKEALVFVDRVDPDKKSVTETREEQCCLRNDVSSSRKVDALSERPVVAPIRVDGCKLEAGCDVRGATVKSLQQRLSRNKSHQPLSVTVSRQKAGDAFASPSAVAGRYPAVIGTCSLSPRPVCGREPVRGFSALKSAGPSSSGLSSSSEERLPAGMSSRVAASLVAASSSSLPARSNLSGDSWSKLPALSGTRVPSADSSDSESGGNMLQWLRGKAALSRLSGFRSSVDSRMTKSRLPTQNLNVNVHFFDRLREQESQNSRDKDVTKAEQRCSPLPPSRQLSVPPRAGPRSFPGGEARISERIETEDSVPDVGSAIDVVSGIHASHHAEVARLSCRSTESHDSFSHDSEHSTQPSDEGVYSDDSVAASVDELRPPRTDLKTATGPSSTAAVPSATALGISDSDDIFWSCPVNFRNFVVDSGGENVGRRNTFQDRLSTELCYEDRLECDLNGCVDVNRSVYFMCILEKKLFTVHLMSAAHVEKF